MPKAPAARAENASFITLAAATEHEGERRQLTVLFADVVGATTLSGQLDPEALRALLREYQTVCVESVGRYDGTIHQRTCTVSGVQRRELMAVPDSRISWDFLYPNDEEFAAPVGGVGRGTP